MSDPFPCDQLTFELVRSDQSIMTVRAIVFEVDEETGARSVKDIFEYEGRELEDLRPMIRAVRERMIKDSDGMTRFMSHWYEETDFGRVRTDESRCMKVLEACIRLGKEKALFEPWYLSVCASFPEDWGWGKTKQLLALFRQGLTPKEAVERYLAQERAIFTHPEAMPAAS